MNSTLTHASIFTGEGGFDVAAAMAGIRTLWICEKDKRRREAMAVRFPGITTYEDVKTTDWKSAVRPDIVSAGIPCQPFSKAGHRRGKADHRYLWPNACSALADLEPSWFIGENVAGIADLALDTVLSDLEALGYSCEAVNIPACAVGSPHARPRIWILAHANRDGHRDQHPVERNRSPQGADKGDEDQRERLRDFAGGTYPAAWERDWTAVALETCVCGMDDGVSARLVGSEKRAVSDLGLSIVPQLAYEIFRNITLLEFK